MRAEIVYHDFVYVDEAGGRVPDPVDSDVFESFETAMRKAREEKGEKHSEMDCEGVRRDGRRWAEFWFRHQMLQVNEITDEQYAEKYG